MDDTLISLAMDNKASIEYASTSLEPIAQLFQRTSYDLLAEYADDREFSVLHEVLLGIDCNKGSLEEYLASFGQIMLPPEIIDAPDSCGRTALAWAVEYGWSDAVNILLKYGSDPHQLRPSMHGKSPLLHLVIAGPASQASNPGFLDVVRALLRSGVDVNAVDHEGWTALHVAASWNLYSVIQELAHYGGSTLNWNAKTDDRQSALDLSLGAGIDDEVQQLLLYHSSGPHQTYEEVQEVELCHGSGICIDGKEGYDNDNDADDFIERFYDAVEIV